MEIFLDTADIDEIRKYASVIDGVTTNPSLVAAQGGRFSFNDLINEIAAEIPGPISVEAVSHTADEMVEEGRALAGLSPNIVIKLPMTEAGLAATRRLQAEGIPVNVTLIFSANQAFLAAKAGASYASIFVGRLDDIGHDGMQVVEDAVTVMKNYDFPTKVLTASIRHPMHVLRALKAGSQVATIPPNVLAQLYRHPLSDAGLEKFLADWQRMQDGGR
ncbi:MAG: fructose-6-phosphate aldolase [Methanomicrobiales archaeon]|nr:fructose-6-phosphate aldolase [Methanomicrobiales archaeon]